MPNPKGWWYPKGHVRRPDKDHLIAQHRARPTPLHLMEEGPVAPLPSVWDSSTFGIIGTVKDQGSCGSCWCFSGVGVVEVAYNAVVVPQHKALVVLSEEYVLDCGRNGGCSGDDNTTVLDMCKATGICSTADYGPYDAGTGHVGRCRWKKGMTLNKISDWSFADPQQPDGVASTDAIKKAIMTYGCVGAAIAADQAFMDSEPGVVFEGSGSEDIDHDIILYGWDDTKGKKGAWKLRNSWGVGWCDNGNSLIAYGANLVGTEAVWATAGVVPPPPPPPPPPPTGVVMNLTGDLARGQYILTPVTGLRVVAVTAEHAAAIEQLAAAVSHLTGIKLRGKLLP